MSFPDRACSVLTARLNQVQDQTLLDKFSQWNAEILDMAKTGDSHRLASLSAEIREQREAMVDFFGAYEARVKDLFGSWFEIYWKHYLEEKSLSRAEVEDLISIDDDGKIDLDMSLNFDDARTRGKYWPALFKKINGAVTLSEDISSLKNTEEIDATLTLFGVKNLDAPKLKKVQTLNRQYQANEADEITSQAELNFPELIEIDNIFMNKFKSLSAPKLKKVRILDLKWATSADLHALDEIDYSLSLSNIDTVDLSSLKVVNANHYDSEGVEVNDVSNLNISSLSRIYGNTTMKRCLIHAPVLEEISGSFELVKSSGKFDQLHTIDFAFIDRSMETWEQFRRVFPKLTSIGLFMHMGVREEISITVGSEELKQKLEEVRGKELDFKGSVHVNPYQGPFKHPNPHVQRV